MSLAIYYGKRVKIITSDTNQAYIGKVSDYCYPEDNEDGKESIVIECEELKRPVEFGENEIGHIEVL